MMLAEFPFQRPRIADDAPDQAVVVRVCRDAEPIVQSGVELMFVRLRKRAIGYLNSETLQPRARNENQEREIRNAIVRQVSQPLLDKVFSGQAITVGFGRSRRRWIV